MPSRERGKADLSSGQQVDRPAKPFVQPIATYNIPQALQELPQWVNWKPAWRDGWTKIPIKRVELPGGGASYPHIDFTDPVNWADFESTVYPCVLHERHGVIGLGFVPSKEAGITIIDLDKCRDPATGAISAWAQRIIDLLDSYTEVSPSGKGIRIPVFGLKPGPRCTAHGLGGEIYDEKHWLTFTGDHLPGTPRTVNQRQAQIEQLYGEWFPLRPAPLLDAQGLPTHNGVVVCGSLPELPHERVIERARRYVARIPGAVSGQRGSARTAHVACVLVVDFGLSVSEALPLLEEWNRTCSPPWPTRELLRRLEWALARPDARGRLLMATWKDPNHFERLDPELAAFPRDVTFLLNGVPWVTFAGGQVVSPWGSDGAAEIAPAVPGAPGVGDSVSADELDTDAVAATFAEARAGADEERRRATETAQRHADEERREAEECRCLRPLPFMQTRLDFTGCRYVDYRCKTCIGCVQFRKRAHERNTHKHIRGEASLDDDSNSGVFIALSVPLTSGRRAFDYDRFGRGFGGRFLRIDDSGPAGEYLGASSGRALVVGYLDVPDPFAVGWVRQLRADPGAEVAVRQVTKAEALELVSAAIARHDGRGPYIHCGQAWRPPRLPAPAKIYGPAVGLPPDARQVLTSVAESLGLTPQPTGVPEHHRHRFVRLIYFRRAGWASSPKRWDHFIDCVRFGDVTSYDAWLNNDIPDLVIQGWRNEQPADAFDLVEVGYSDP